MTYTAGQFLVVRTPGFFGALIRLATRSQVNHAAVCIGNGNYVEARMRGARIANLDGVLHGAKSPYLMVSSNVALTKSDEFDVCEAAMKLVGTGYNFLDIVALGLISLGWRWRWLLNRAQREDRLICSQLVDRAYANAGLHLYKDGRPDGAVTPGDLLLFLAARNEVTL